MKEQQVSVFFKHSRNSNKIGHYNCSFLISTYSIFQNLAFDFHISIPVFESTIEHRDQVIINLERYW